MAFYFWQVAYSPNLNVEGKEKFVLYVPKNATYESLMDTLHKYKIINDEVAFGFMTKRMGLKESIKPGRYEIKPNAANKEIISKIRSGNQDPVKLTFNNVRTKEDLIKKIGTKLDFDSNVLLEKMKNEEACAKYGFTSETIMCMFLPDTYFIYWNSSVEDFMDRMKTEYEKFWNDKRLAQAKVINMTPIQVGVMASIVQSETNKPDEMPRVAGVYVNRIATDMPLQADPTVKFAVGDFSLKRILTKHLMTPSPYNTYINTGLPPGPIALPERVALDAVLGYEKHNYTYFCAKEDFSGYHNFAATYTEHLKNADIYQAALDARGIK
jgi:UPF0755 protein